MCKFKKYFNSGGLHIEEAERIANIIQTYNIQSILEIGCGLSSTSLFLDYTSDLTTYEDNNEWAKIVSERFNHEVKTYTPGILKITQKYDLIFIDGPSGSENREGSFISSINKSKFVLIHDSFGDHIQNFINEHLLKNKLYSVIPFSPLTQTSGLTLLKNNYE